MAGNRPPHRAGFRGRAAHEPGNPLPALLRLEQRGWIASRWGLSEHNRRARFYNLTRKGQKQLTIEEEKWQRMSAIVARILQPSPQGSAG